MLVIRVIERRKTRAEIVGEGAGQQGPEMLDTKRILDTVQPETQEKSVVGDCTHHLPHHEGGLSAHPTYHSHYTRAWRNCILHTTEATVRSAQPYRVLH